MAIKDIEEFFQRFAKSPLKATLLLLVLVAVVVGGAWLASYAGKAGEDYFVTKKGTVSVERMLVGRLVQNSRLDLTIRNALTSDAVIRRIRLEAHYFGGSECCCPPTDTITLSDRMQISRSTEAGSVEGTFRMASTEAYAYPARGTLNDSNCDSLDLDLQMDTAIGLTKGALTTLRIVVPATMRVTHVERSGRLLPGQADPAPSLSSYRLDLSRFQSFAVRLDLSNGQSITATYPEEPVDRLVNPTPPVIVAPRVAPDNSTAH